MQTTEPTHAWPRRRRRRGPAARWARAGIVAVAWIGVGSACLAADTISGLGSAFRPQGAADAAPERGKADKSAATPAGLRVVVTGASRSVASIDGQLVHVGDTVNGMRVTQINAQGVVLKGEGGAGESLMVAPSVVKRKHVESATRIAAGDRP